LGKPFKWENDLEGIKSLATATRGESKRKGVVQTLLFWELTAGFALT